MKLILKAPPVAAAILLALLLSFPTHAETETQGETQTTTSVTGSLQQYLQFSMVSSPVPGAPGYSEGNGSAEIQVQGTLLSVHMQAQGMSPGSHFMLSLTANGTLRSVANMSTGYDGEVEAEAAVSLNPGHYSLGLKVFDTSSFGSPTLVMVSDPTNEPIVLSQSTPSTGEGEGTQYVNTVTGGQTEDDGINTAISTKFIPAVVQIGASTSSVYLSDGSFAVSVGRFQQDGYLIFVSANNVVGPRVILVNLTAPMVRSLFSNPLLIALDGVQVQQAASFAQVLGAQPGDPARFVVVSGASGLRLLVSIPHFSSHTIEILPILAQLGNSLLLSPPTLLLSVAAVSALIFVLYSRRARFEFGGLTRRLG